MGPLRDPAASLDGFPVHLVRPSRALFRIHPTRPLPWWFSSDGSSGFDLGPVDGTCYLAEAPIGALLEVCKGSTPVSREFVHSRRLSTLRLPQRVRLADCTRARAAAFGVTAEIHSSPDRDLTRAWARAFDRAGFGGVRYLLSHDPTQRCVGIAMFGSAGEVQWPVVSTTPIPEELLREARSSFGIDVVD